MRARDRQVSLTGCDERARGVGGARRRRPHRRLPLHVRVGARARRQRFREFIARSGVERAYRARLTRRAHVRVLESRRAVGAVRGHGDG